MVAAKHVCQIGDATFASDKSCCGDGRAGLLASEGG
jgi:hypothetical protein